ncbi:hypothetical protein AU188_17240 [Mycobacterium sp. IS-3022]|nr:hypothetical protein AU188_17240 [Mycobacterium sp. IS-3022]
MSVSLRCDGVTIRPRNCRDISVGEQRYELAVDTVGDAHISVGLLIVAKAGPSEQIRQAAAIAVCYDQLVDSRLPQYFSVGGLKVSAFIHIHGSTLPLLRR